MRLLEFILTLMMIAIVSLSVSSQSRDQRKKRVESKTEAKKDVRIIIENKDLLKIRPVEYEQEGNEESHEAEESTIPHSNLITGVFTDDRDGVEYLWVQIGEQVWMADNLKYLPSVVGPGIGSPTEPMYYVYDYDGTDVNAAKATANYQNFGVLYNWPAFMAGSSSSDSSPSGVKGVCPQEWHVPSDKEWKVLELYLGMPEEDINLVNNNNRAIPAGKLLKSADFWYLYQDNAVGANESGFSALPGGVRGSGYGGRFSNLSYSGWFWTSTATSPSYAGEPSFHAWYRRLAYSINLVYYYVEGKEKGMSVRCVKDAD